MQVRVGKPQRHRDGFRCMLSALGTGYRSWGPVRATPAAAIASAESSARAAERSSRTVAEAIAAYLEDGKARGLRSKSLDNRGCRLARALPADAELGAVTRRAVEQRLQDSRQGRAVDTVRSYLAEARQFFGWCIEQGWIRANPSDGIKIPGRKRKGKPQLRRDEARKIWVLARQLATDGDDGALMVLLALGCAMRASEIVTRTVRDVDDGGRILWVDAVGDWETKTEASRRPIELPSELQPLVLARCASKLPGALVFQASRGAQHHYTFVRRQVHRLCKLAGVPIVCAHSMRGLHATIAIQEGLSPRIVADTLGHESESMTLGHYAKPGSSQIARGRAAIEVLRGGKKD